LSRVFITSDESFFLRPLDKGVFFRYSIHRKGGVMKVLGLKGEEILIDKKDWEKMVQAGNPPLNVQIGKTSSCVYFSLLGCRLQLGRFIVGAKGEEVVDHINGDALDNRRLNLRKCTQKENVRNRRKETKRKTSSQYKGVHRTYTNMKKPWRADIRVDKKKRWLGRYKTEEGAAKAYDKAARKFFGEFACCNFAS
jgi:hypothetical protein